VHAGLLECPATTRLAKVIDGTYVVEGPGGACAERILTFQECFHAAAATLGLGGQTFTNETGSDPSRPAGCSATTVVAPSDADDDIDAPPLDVHVFFNTLTASDTACAAGAGALAGATRSLVDVSVALDGSSSAAGNATITLTGPADVWFGVGFGAQAMGDRPWTIVVDGGGDSGGAVSERYLGGPDPNSHVAGDPLPPSVTVVSSSVSADGKRTVVLSRPLQGAGPHYYTFNVSATGCTVPFINAVGASPTLAYVCAVGDFYPTGGNYFSCSARAY
jgi:hypothetical protein